MLKKTAAFIVVCLFLFCAAFAQEPLKVLSVNFDNSDNLIHMGITGNLGNMTIERGVLPDRVYYDISNAVITFPSKSWELKYSQLSNVKISQFSKDPNIVRIVVTPADANLLNSIRIVRKNNQMLIRYGNDFFKNDYYSAMYEKKPDKQLLEATTAREEMTVNVASDIGKSEENDLKNIFNAQSQKLVTGTLKLIEKETNIKSLYYLNGINAKESGVIIKGIGLITPSLPFTLQNPSRVVFDINNAVVAQSLRNKTYNLNETESVKLGQFDPTTARVVITTSTPEKYKAIVSPDLENLLLTTDEKTSSAKLTDNIGTVTKMKWDESAKSLSFNFTQPVVSSYSKDSKNSILEFYNTASFSREDLAELNKISKFSHLKVQQVNKDRIKVIVPTDGFSTSKYEISADAMNVKLSLNPKSNSIISTVKPIIKPSRISNYYKVVIDAGHGGSDVGAMRGTVLEKDITLKVASYLSDMLTNDGVHVDMTRRNDATVSLQDRVAFANEKEPDIFVSVHVNATVRNDVKGIETHWYHEHGLELAQKIHAQLKEKINSPDRGLFKSQFYVINHTEAPSVLVEIGFISNDEERAAMLTEKRQKETARAIADGIMNYLKNRGQ